MQRGEAAAARRRKLGIHREPASPIRVLLVARQAALRAGLRMLFLGHARFVVTGEAGDASGAEAAARVEPPQIILLDPSPGTTTGIEEVLPRLRGAAPGARAVVLGQSLDAAARVRAVSLGALGIVEETQSPEAVFEAIAQVHSGGTWLDGPLLATVLGHALTEGGTSATEPSGRLTPREREVVGLVGEGLRNKEIAQRLFLSEATVRHHLTSIFEKLGVNDRLQLVVFAYRHRLISLP